ncbi:MAG: hypothetical protein L3J37_04710 [Rhodobacteraceae bacterium]|nr:hypothetical protein [Paracoccaceae bacterium]
MENIYTYIVYAGAVLTILGLVGLGISVRMAFKIKKDAIAGEDTKDRMQTLIALNTAALGFSFIGLALVAVGVLLG